MTKGYAETVADNLINGWIEFGWIDQKHARSLKASMIHHLADKDSVQPDAVGIGEIEKLAEAAIEAAHKWGMCQATYTTADDEKRFHETVAAFRTALRALPAPMSGDSGESKKVVG